MKCILICNNDFVVTDVLVQVTETEYGKLVKTKNGEEYFIGYEALYIEIDDEDIPSDYKSGLYIFKDGVFEKNQNYMPPQKSQIELEKEIETLKLMVADLGLMAGGGL